MFLIGLTGGIAAGKSTVARFWQSLGAVEIDADMLAREVVAPGTNGAKEVANEFGAEYFSQTGELNRSKLGELVFSDSEARENLESIVHPLVKAKAKELIAQADPNAIVVYTVPLLVEANVDLPFDAVVTVEAPEDVRIKRLIESRGMSREEAANRIANQAKPIERAARADYVLNSNQSLDLLIADARELWEEFCRRADSKK